jgi:hypothetical protein
MINYDMPTFINIRGDTFTCKCKTCGEGGKPFILATLESHFEVLKMPFFKCPVPGCNHKVARQSKTITGHLLKSHPKISTGLKLIEGKTALFCMECNSYTNTLHFHCKECERADATQVRPEGGVSTRPRATHFPTKEGLDEHLKAEHNKWWLEKPCKRGTTCPGFKNGHCGFNHLKHPEDFIRQDTKEKVCRYEMPWKNVRCSNLTCSFDHLWGRVRWILKEKSKTTEFSAPLPQSEGGGPESIRDDVTATSSDLPDVGFNVSSIQIDDTVGVEVDSDLADENLDEDDSDNTDGSGF